MPFLPYFYDKIGPWDRQYWGKILHCEAAKLSEKNIGGRQ